MAKKLEKAPKTRGQPIPTSFLALHEKVTAVPLRGEGDMAGRKDLSLFLLPDIKPMLLAVLESLTHRISIKWHGLNDWYLAKLKTNRECYSYFSLSTTYSKLKAVLVILLRVQNSHSETWADQEHSFWGDMAMKMDRECGLNSLGQLCRCTWRGSVFWWDELKFRYW